MLLRVDDLHVSYGSRSVLNGVSFEVSPGVVLITGRNGSGKTTLLKSLFGLVVSSSGNGLLDGRSFLGLPPLRLREMGISYMPQGAPVFPDLSCRENLMVAAYPCVGTEEARRRINDFVSLVPFLEGRIDSKAGTLSQGERHWLALCMAFMPKPRLLLMDEPVAALSEAAVTQWCQVFAGLLAEYDAGALIAEQRTRPFSRMEVQIMELSNGVVSRLAHGSSS